MFCIRFRLGFIVRVGVRKWSFSREGRDGVAILFKTGFVEGYGYEIFWFKE